jgi:hypothetical protein
MAIERRAFLRNAAAGTLALLPLPVLAQDAVVQARGSGADDDDMACLRSCHAAALAAFRFAIRILDPVPQQHCTTFQQLMALQRHRRDGSTLISLALRGVEQAWRPLRAVYGRTKDQIEFVDQSRTQKGAIGATSAFEQQTLHAEFATENVECKAEIELRLSREDVGHAMRRPAKCPSATVSERTTTMGSPPMSERPQAILPRASSTTP